jgi:hypothetical protein
MTQISDPQLQENKMATPRVWNAEQLHYQKRKKLNTPEFNRMANKRRAKAKFDAKARKRNRRK